MKTAMMFLVLIASVVYLCVTFADAVGFKYAVAGICLFILFCLVVDNFIEWRVREHTHPEGKSDS